MLIGAAKNQASNRLYVEFRASRCGGIGGKQSHGVPPRAAIEIDMARLLGTVRRVLVSLASRSTI